MFLPRRLNVHDVDYDPKLGALLEISLDDAEQDGVVAYDIDAGWLTRYRKDGEGRIIIWDGRGLVETVHGIVTVALRRSCNEARS